MIKRSLAFLVLFLLFTLGMQAVPTENRESVVLLTTTTHQEDSKLLPTQNLREWDIPAANYSGISPVCADTFAVVDDKSPSPGFYLFNIQMDSTTGKITHVERLGFHGTGESSAEDNEDLVFVPKSQSLFITSEALSSVEEFDLSGHKTGRRLNVPEQFGPKNTDPNNGLESLAHDKESGIFWLTTECPLPADGMVFNGTDSVGGMRIQSFGADLNPQQQWAYRLEPPLQKKNASTKDYIHGIPALLSLGKDRLLVMEREVTIPSSYFGSRTSIRIFLVNLKTAAPVASGKPLKELEQDKFLQKREIAAFETALNLTKLNFANFEGMCLGPTLKDGRRTLILINDSQDGAGNSLYHLKDYLKVIVLPSGL